MRQNFSIQVDQTFILIISISVVLLLIVTIAMIYFVIRYSKKRNPVATDITGNTKLEIIWTLIPTILVLIMFWSSYSGFKLMRNAPSDAMTINVTGQMWKWTFEYENGKKADTLYVPLGKAIKMVIKSIDVNHSFFLPHFRVKEDAIPGRTNYLWFDAVELGSWDIACAEYCGLRHAYMYTKVKVVPENEFNIWYNIKDSLSAVKDTIAKDTIK
jgi:cytochrome c oxidase subunit 2